MTHRTFQFRLHSDHGSQGPAETAPVVERLNDEGVWEVQEPGLSTPPFRLSLIALLLCMRFHLIREASDRQIPLQRLRATLTVEVTEDWDIARWSADFTLVLDAAAGREACAKADAAALAALRNRMEHSPVVRNLPHSAPHELQLTLS